MMDVRVARKSNTDSTRRLLLRALTRAKLGCAVALIEQARAALVEDGPARTVRQRASRAVKRAAASATQNLLVADLEAAAASVPFRLGKRVGHVSKASVDTRCAQLHSLYLGLCAKYGSAHLARLRARVGMLNLTVDGPPQLADRAPSRQELHQCLSSMQAAAAGLGTPVALLAMAFQSDAFADALTAIFASAWASGELPLDWCVSKVVLVYKTGPIDSLTSYRVLGVSSAVSKLFQTLVARRLTEHMEPLLCPNQFGFRATTGGVIAASFTLTSALNVAAAAGEQVTVTFADVTGAFPNTCRIDVLSAFQRARVPARLLRLLAYWYTHQQLFAVDGGLCTPLLDSVLGVGEGCVFSPISYITVTDAASRALAAVPGVRLIGNETLSHVSLADDIATLSPTTPTAAAQSMLCVLEEEYAVKLKHSFSFGGKTAGLVWALPAGGAQPAVPPGQLELTRTLVPFVPSYTHLGLVLGEGQRATRVLQDAKQLRLCAIVLSRVARSGLALHPLSLSLLLYRQRLRPTATYGLALCFSKVPQPVLKMEGSVLAMVFGVANLPLVALRAAAGMPSIHTQHDLWIVLMLMQFLACPPQSLLRAQLALEAAVYKHGPQGAKSSFWWAAVHDRLTLMDEVTAAAGVPLHAHAPVSWVQWATLLAESRGELTLRASVTAAARAVLLRADGGRLRAELAQRPSLSELYELLDSPNAWPFLVCLPSEARALRVRALGGRRCLWSFHHYHVSICPHCYLDGGYSVPHIVRDCIAFADEREACWHAVYAAGVAANLVSAAAQPSATTAHLWYKFTMGAPVPHAFLRLNLDRQTHFARGATLIGMSKHIPAYRRLLRLTDAFLDHVVVATQQQLDEASGTLPATARGFERPASVLRSAMWLPFVARPVALGV